jgi:hypothetical protein
MDWSPNSGPVWFGACRADTNLTFVVDRVTNPTTNSWSDGLAFQPRSPDSAVIRTPNEVESFQASPRDNEVQHNSWAYSKQVVPPPGQVSCNGPSPCSPSFPQEESITKNYVASIADPTAASPPHITSVNMPVAALSPDQNDVAVFFVDGNGSLYASQETFSSGVGTWRTWLVMQGLPPNAPLAVLRATREPDKYQLFWAASDGLVGDVIVSTVQGPMGSKFASSYVSGPPGARRPYVKAGAAIAAVARTPTIADVFVVGFDAAGPVVWDLRGDPSSSTFTSSEVMPTSGVLNAASGITASAPSVDDLDVFFFSTAGTLQRVYATNLSSAQPWTLVALPTQAAAGQLALSSVSRGPDNVDVLSTCGAGLCITPVDSNLYPGTFVSSGVASEPSPGTTRSVALPAIGGAVPPFSLVAQNGTSLDAFVPAPQSNGQAFSYDVSWQNGDTSFGSQPSDIVFIRIPFP